MGHLPFDHLRLLLLPPIEFTYMCNCSKFTFKLANQLRPIIGFHSARNAPNTLWHILDYNWANDDVKLGRGNLIAFIHNDRTTLLTCIKWQSQDPAPRKMHIYAFDPALDICKRTGPVQLIGRLLQKRERAAKHLALFHCFGISYKNASKLRSKD